MAEFLTLRGRNALSPFRVTNLLAEFAGIRITGLAADFWHFVVTSRVLSAPERATLERLLVYGPQGVAESDRGQLLLVIPRPGTISSWASKATDIAHGCGLDIVERIERGVAYRFTTRDGTALTDTERTRLLPRIHDRMTEAVYPTLEDAQRLFTHVQPQPMAVIDLIGHGRNAIVAANVALGLA